MSKVQITQRHHKPDDEVRDIVRSVEQELISRFGLATQWTDDRSVSFKRSGLSGELVMGPGRVTVNMKLGLVLGLYSRAIQTELERTLARKLG